jgi:hypothetical protein
MLTQEGMRWLIACRGGGEIASVSPLNVRLRSTGRGRCRQRIILRPADKRVGIKNFSLRSNQVVFLRASRRDTPSRRACPTIPLRNSCPWISAPQRPGFKVIRSHKETNGTRSSSPKLLSRRDIPKDIQDQWVTLEDLSG